MSEDAGRAVLRRLVARMQADPGVLDKAVAAARDRSPPVAALPVHEVRRHIAALLSAVAAAFLDSSGLGEHAQVADRLAADRAVQGVPLSALLDGFQAGRVAVMTSVMAAGLEAGLATAPLLDALVELDSYTNALQHRLIHAYREMELGLARTEFAVRTQALRDLLHGDPAAGPDLLDPARRYHCLLADVTDPRQAREVEALVTTPDGLSGLVDGYLAGVASRLPAARPAGDLLVVATPAVCPADLPAAYRLCRAALEAARSAGLRGLRHLADLVLPLTAGAHPALGAMLAAERFAGLDPADPFHRLLATTALAYLEHGGRADLTAVSLHVHTNTVKHRLRRLAELTGFGGPPAGPGDALADALRWWYALRAWLPR
ncbi:MAG: PucR family transcriptional regulator [Mycobacteriales bacterium]